MASRAQTAKLSRQRNKRNALLRGLSESLIFQESIVTTDAKARSLRPHIEKMVTKAKDDSRARRRLIRSRLNTDEASDKLFTDIAPRFRRRPGGYTRLSRAGFRRGDNAPLTRISFVEEHAQQSDSSSRPTTTPAPAEETAEGEQA